MPGLPDLQHHRLGPAADRDGLGVDGQRLPPALVQSGSPGWVELLQVEILRIAARGRESPGHAVVVADLDAGRHGERDAADVDPRRGQMHLEPQGGHLPQQMRVVRQERRSRYRPRSGDHPVVRSDPRWWQDGVVEQFERRRRPARAPLLPGDDRGRLRRRFGEQGPHRLPPEPLGDLGPKQLGVPVRRQHPRHECHHRGAVRRAAVPARVGLGVDADDLVLDRARRHGLDPGVCPGDDRLHELIREVVERMGDPRRGPIQADRSEESIQRQRDLAEQAGQTAVGEPKQQVLLEESLRGEDVARREVEIPDVVRVDVRHSPSVAKDLNRFAQPREADLTVDRWKGCPGPFAKSLR